MATGRIAVREDLALPAEQARGRSREHQPLRGEHACLAPRHVLHRRREVGRQAETSGGLDLERHEQRVGCGVGSGQRAAQRREQGGERREKPAQGLRARRQETRRAAPGNDLAGKNKRQDGPCGRQPLRGGAPDRLAGLYRPEAQQYGRERPRHEQRGPGSIEDGTEPSHDLTHHRYAVGCREQGQKERVGEQSARRNPREARVASTPERGPRP